MRRNRLWPYIFLNVFVSACVTISILVIYDRFFRPDAGTGGPPDSALSQTPLAGDINMEITSIIGAGIADSEILVLKNNGTESVAMSGWILRDGDGNVYTFPQLDINPGGTVQVHTVAGIDSAINLYWGLSTPVWRAGEAASLFDAQGSLRAAYTIP
jgi:hypothetical protein